MFNLRTTAACLAGALALAPSLAHAQEELKNDGFGDGETAAFQSGFVAGEIGASRFVAPRSGMKLVSVQLLFGGNMDGVKQNIELHVWDDTALTDEPGEELYSAQYEITAADTALHVIDLDTTNFVLPDTFRVGIELQHDGLPSLARDDDGTIDPDKNFLFAEGLGWKKSADLGVTGDWVIRAIVDSEGGSGGAGGTGGEGGAGQGGAGGTGGTSTGGGGTGGGGVGGFGDNSGGAGGGGDDDGGDCGCRAAGADATPGGALLALLASTLVLGARRRRR